jgi:hypothetical protein
MFLLTITVIMSCRETPEPPKPEVESLLFISKNVTMKVGERQAVKIDVKPVEARNYANVTYTASAEGYIAIGEESSDGCVITAKKGGTVVLVAKAGSYTAYLEVKITGDQFIQEPYIMVAAQVIEVFEGARKTAQVSLYNGSAVDQQLFQWSVESGKDNISINPVGNTVVVQGEKRGSQKITIKHDKSEYAAEILVFVVGSNEQVRYITTRQNVITMSAGGASHELVANLVGGSPADNAGFTFSTLEEYPCVGLLPGNNSCNIVAYRKGTSVINIHHPLAEYDMQVRVIIAEGDESYLEIDPTFKILDIGQNVIINGTLNGYYLESWKNDWEFTKKGDTDCVTVTQSGSQFFVQARETGRCVLEIRNRSMPSYPREALIVVRDPTAVSPDEWYITTSQNVIQMEAGQIAPAQLSIQLINGIEPDKNNFAWTVEDSNIIKVEPQDAPSENVIYLRSIKKRAQAEIKSVASTIALITAKKVGTTKILIEIEKGGKKLNASVIVKVYPKGTFGSVLYVLGRKEGGIIKVDTTAQAASGKDTPVNLYIAKPDNGDIYGLGKLTWAVKPRSAETPDIVATVQDTHGLDNEIHGISKGINKLTVENEEALKYPFEAIVMVGTAEELASMAALYVEQAHQTLAIGQSAYVQILNSNMTPIVNSKGEITGCAPDPGKLSESDRYYAKYYDRSIVNAVMIKNRLMLQGLSEGLTTVTIGNEAFPDAAPVEVKVTVLSGLTTIDKPYMLTSNANFIGMVWGTQKEYEVRLAGEGNLASVGEEDKIFWSTSNGSLVRLPIHPYGKKILLTAGNGTDPESGLDKIGQSIVTASHSKSINEKVTVVYVVPTEADLEKVVLGIAKPNWLLKPGEEVMLNLITNADDSDTKNINKIKWYNNQGIDYAQGGSDAIIEVDYNGPNAMVRAKPDAHGSTVITVTHPNKVIDLKIFISVSSAASLSKTITLPTIVEMIVNENKVITAVTEGLEQSDINKIEWFVEDESIAAISTDLPLGTDGKMKGGKLYLKGKKKGQTWITASQSDLGFIKKILLVCANTYEELQNTYVMATKESYFRMKKGDVKAISLVYGQAGFPQSKKAEIIWEDIDKNNVIKIHPPQYDYAEIEAVNEGIARVKVNHKDVFKPIELTFEISKDVIPGQNYSFVYTGMMGLVIWKGEKDNDPNSSAYGQSLEMKEPYTKTATLGINPPGLSYSGIVWEDEKKPDAGVADVAASGLGNTFLVTARKKGQTYLKFSHNSNQIPDDARILVYTADTLQELQAMFPIGISRTNYLLNKGDPAETIRITVPSQDSMGLNDSAYKAKLDAISYDTGVLSGGYVADVAINLTQTDLTKYKQEFSITPKGTGSAYIDVKYGAYPNQKPIDRIYISVREKAAGDLNKRIITENIIGLTPATVKRKTSIGTNLNAEERKDLEWVSLDPSVVDIEPAPNDKTSCYLNAKKTGNTEIVVSYGSIERFIKVYVRDNPDEFKEINLDTRYYHLRKNDVLPLTAFHAALPALGDDDWSIPFDNNVVELRKVKDKNGVTVKDRIEIAGINEGIAEIVLRNEECWSDVRFMVEVNNTAPLIETLVEDWYITASKTVYGLDPDRTNDVTRVQVDGVRFTPEEVTKIKWSVVSEELVEGGNNVTHILENEPSYKPGLLTINNTRGSFIDIMPNKKTGTVILRASHARSVNDMDITVICDAKAALVNQAPRLEADKETVKLQLNEEAEVNVFIRDVDGGYDIGEFTAVSDNPQRVSVNIVGNKLQIKGVNFGQALISITHPKVPGYIKKIIVIVMSGDTSLVYLTTKQNFVQLEKGNFQAVEVELAGYNDIQNRNYIWSTDDGDIISINDSGKTAVITAKNVARTAKIMVQHIACLEYPLYIYVRVTEKNASNPVYITTPNNIVSIKEGAGIQVRANLVNGAGQELSQFVWSAANTNLIELNYAGDSALIRGLAPGTAQVQIWHPSSLNTISMLVVVEPIEPNNGIYIATDNQLIEMTTKESQRLIKVRLIGGEPEDVYGFQWQITSFNSVTKQLNGTSYQPVTILSNADNCYIQPVTQKYEGEAVITVSHPKTNYKLDIKVIIADATEIKFAQAYITINQFAQQMVSITAPGNGALNLTVQQPNNLDPIINAYATNTMCVIEGLKEGTAIVRLSNTGGTKSDELVVRVNKVSLTGYAYINITGNTLINKTLTEKQTVQVQIKGAKNEEDEERLMNAMIKTISNETVADVSKDWGKTRGIDKVFTWTLEVVMKGVGSSELVFSVPDNTANAALLATYPDLKGAVKKVYFKVSEGDNVFGVDRSDIQMYQGGVGEMVIATVDTLRSGGIQATDIRWEIKYPEGDHNDIITLDMTMPANNETGASTVMVNAANYTGSCWIEVHFSYKATKIITVRVNPVEFLIASPTGFTIGPGISQEILVTSNPNDKDITIEFDSNVAVNTSVRGKPNNANSKFNTLPGGGFRTGKDGYIIEVTGSDLQGSVRMMLKMTGTNRQTMITITNVKNYYARWVDKQSLRFRPDTPESSIEVKAYYECNPKTDMLELQTPENLFNAYFNKKDMIGEDSFGKYVWLRPPVSAGYDGTFYRAGSYVENGDTGKPSLHFKTRDTKQDIFLPVYIYYDKIDVEWQKMTNKLPAPNQSNVFDDPRFKFDPVTYALQVPFINNANYKMRINLKVPFLLDSNGKPTAVRNPAMIKAVTFSDKQSNGIDNPNKAGLIEEYRDQFVITKSIDANGESYFTIQRNGLTKSEAAQSPSYDSSKPQTGVTYCGVLDVQYQYNIGGNDDAVFHRKFLVYAVHY